MRAVHPRGRAGRRSTLGALVVGEGCAEGVRDALRDRDRGLRARARGPAWRRQPGVIVNSTNERTEASQLELDDLEAALIAPQVAQMAGAAADSVSRHRYEELAAAINDRHLRLEHQGMV